MSRLKSGKTFPLNHKNIPCKSLHFRCLNIVESNRIIHKTSSKFDLQPQQTSVLGRVCVQRELNIQHLDTHKYAELRERYYKQRQKKKGMSKMGEDRDRVQTDLAEDGICHRRQRTPPKGCRRYRNHRKKSLYTGEICLTKWQLAKKMRNTPEGDSLPERERERDDKSIGLIDHLINHDRSIWSINHPINHGRRSDRSW
jgi:hypothetical protein